MKKSKFSEAEIFKILKLGEGGMSTTDICREYKISQPTYYSWRAKYGGMELPMIKKMYAEVCMDKQILQEVIEKKL